MCFFGPVAVKEKVFPSPCKHGSEGRPHSASRIASRARHEIYFAATQLSGQANLP
jgi:hypothetical protein